MHDAWYSILWIIPRSSPIWSWHPHYECWQHNNIFNYNVLINSKNPTVNDSLCAEPDQIPSNLNLDCTPINDNSPIPMNDILWNWTWSTIQFYYDDITPSDHPNQYLPLALFPIRIDSLHTITLSPIPMQSMNLWIL